MFTVSAEIKDFKGLDAILEAAAETYEKKAEQLHRKAVFDILTLLFRLTPVDTGRLRAAWTPIFDKYGQASRYQKWAGLPSLTPAARKTPKKGFDARAFEEGKKDGKFTDSPLNTVIVNGVVYAEFVENRYAFVARVVTHAAPKYQRVFDAYHALLEEKGIAAFPDVDESAEGDTLG